LIFIYFKSKVNYLPKYGAATEGSPRQEQNLRVTHPSGAMMPLEDAMKSTGKKSKQVQGKGSGSRDKVRKTRDDSHAAEKIGKSRTPLADRRADTRAQRRVTKEELKEVQTKFNG
jgi:hypothetical protein